jgi:hypothetical protein
MNDVPSPGDNVQAAPDNIGRETAEFSIEIGARLLEQFSGLLYSSPQKAFEELISNGWDAGADYVDVRIPTDLSVPEATMTVLDNGSSMDEQRLPLCKCKSACWLGHRWPVSRSQTCR